ncbi:hypothetical protein SHIRM173S_08660 [Streptomyces hirsutus]
MAVRRAVAHSARTRRPGPRGSAPAWRGRDRRDGAMPGGAGVLVRWARRRAITRTASWASGRRESIREGSRRSRSMVPVAVSWSSRRTAPSPFQIRRATRFALALLVQDLELQHGRCAVRAVDGENQGAHAVHRRAGDPQVPAVEEAGGQAGQPGDEGAARLAVELLLRRREFLGYVDHGEHGSTALTAPARPFRSCPGSPGRGGRLRPRRGGKRWTAGVSRPSAASARARSSRVRTGREPPALRIISGPRTLRETPSTR